MNELTDAEIDTSLARGKAARLHEPRAATARYDRVRKRVVVELTNGCTFAFPPRLAQGLGSATEDQLAQIEVLGSGIGLHWDTLDVDLAVPDLLAGCSGPTPTWPATPARRGGPPKRPPRAPTALRAGVRASRPDTLLAYRVSGTLKSTHGRPAAVAGPRPLHVYP